jgi:adenosylhomocysteine nucleosidase
VPTVPSASRPADHRITAIIAAMPEEVAPLRARLIGARGLSLRGGTGAAEVVLGHLDGVAVALAVTGDGARNAREGVAALLGHVEVNRLIALGVAGALSPDLAEGALVVAEQVMLEGGGPGTTLRADQALVESAVRATGARRGVVMTAGRIADTAAEKQRLFGLIVPAGTAAPASRLGGTIGGTIGGASSGATSAVVDLESADYIGAAARAGIPWIVLRAVSDTADEALPALLNRSRDEGGAVRRGSVVRGLLGDPGALPALLGLRRRVQLGAGVLSRATSGLLSSPALERGSSSPSTYGEGEGPALGSPRGILT